MKFKINIGSETLFWDVFIFYAYGCLAISVSVSHASLVTMEIRKGCQMPWYWSYKLLLAKMWALGTKPRSSGRAANELLNH